MDQKSIINRINQFADWFIRLIILNILIIIFSLPVITLYPAISAGYNVLHNYTIEKDVHLFKDYFNFFKEELIKKIGLGILLFLILLIGFTNIRYYSQTAQGANDYFYLIGYYVTLTLISISFAVMMLTLIVIKVAPKTKIIHTFKLSLVLAGKFYFRTVVLILLNITPVLLLFTPITSLILVFMGVSLPLLLNVIITKPAVYYLESLGEKNG